MTTKELAIVLNERERGNETTIGIRQLANDNRLVIVYGVNNDRIDFDGEEYKLSDWCKSCEYRKRLNYE